MISFQIFKLFQNIYIAQFTLLQTNTKNLKFQLVLKVPLVANASMFVTVAQKTPFVILSKAVSAGMDLKVSVC